VPSIPPVAALALGLLIAAALFWLVGRVALGLAGAGGGGGGDTILLCGACGAGKTSLYQMLRLGSTCEGSVTSMAVSTLRPVNQPLPCTV
jgi:hypothetical protein